MRSVVIGIDGACSVNNRQDPNSRAAYGVFFGPNCQYNKCGFLKSYAVQSSNRAELEAVRQALRIVQSRRNSGEFDSWRQIILKTDSEYVANTLSEWVWGWQEKGWVRSKGKAIEHLDLIQELHSTIGEIEACMLPCYLQNRDDPVLIVLQGEQSDSGVSGVNGMKTLMLLLNIL